MQFDTLENKKAVLLQGNRTMPQLCVGLKFADIHKCKSSQAPNPKAMRQISRHTGAKTEFNVKWSFKFQGHSRSSILGSLENQ